MLRKITQDFKLVGQERAPLKKWSFVKSQVLQILNLSMSEGFWESFIEKTQISSENYKPFWNFLPGRVTEIHPSSKD